MKSIKFLSVLLLSAIITTTANAASYYWVTVDRSLDGIYMNVRVVQTADSTPPTVLNLGKNTEVSAGPFSSKGEARTNCEKTIKLIKKNGQFINNFCSKTDSGK